MNDITRPSNEIVTDERLRNTLVWAEARIGSLSGADVIYNAIRELLERRAASEPRADLWNAHGNSGMRHMDESDVTGGETDCSYSRPTCVGDPIYPRWRYKDKQGMYAAEAWRLYAMDLERAAQPPSPEHWEECPKCGVQWLGENKEHQCNDVGGDRASTPGDAYRVFCPEHDAHRARYTDGRPELDDQCPQCVIASLRTAIGLAYGHLWHVNNEPGMPQYPPERASYAARKILRDLLTHEQRGDYINQVRTALTKGTG